MVEQTLVDLPPEPEDVASRPPRMPYGEFATKYFPHYFPLAPSLMHLDFIDRLTDWHLTRGRKECYVAPAEGAKTTHWSKIYPLYCIAYDLERFVLLMANVAGQAGRNLEAIKAELEGNYLFARDFPHCAGIGRVWNSNEIVTRNGIKIAIAGRGTAIRGATFGASRITLMIGDDLDDDESIGTQEARDKAWDWLTRTAIPRGQSGHCNVVVIDTLKHDNDITQRCKKTPGWFYRRYKSLIRPADRKDLWSEWAAIYRQQTIEKNEGLIAEDADPAREFYLAREEEMKAGSEVLWEAKEPLYALMLYIQQNGEKSFATEKQGEPRSSTETEWPAECFDESVVYFQSWPYIAVRGLAGDPSKGKGALSDPSAWVWGGYGPDGLLYVDADIRRRDSSDICSHGIDVAMAFRPQGIVMEQDSYGAIGDLWDRIQSEKMADDLPDLKLIGQSENKVVRIRRGLTERLRNYKIRFRANSIGVSVLIGQLKGFPRTTEHDDGPDALDMLIKLLDLLEQERDNPAEDAEPFSVRSVVG